MPTDPYKQNPNPQKTPGQSQDDPSKKSQQEREQKSSWEQNPEKKTPGSASE